MDDMGPYFDELHKDAQKLIDQVEESIKHWHEGNHAGAALVLGLMHYPLGQIQDEVSGLLRDYAKRGISPDDALKQLG